MNIAVISPHYEHTGVTTLASLIAFELSYRGGKVCLTHSLPRSESLYRYFGLDTVVDRTINPARLVKMLKEGAIKMEEVSDYCRALSDKVDLFSADSDTFTQSDMLYALEFITTTFPHDYIVYDVDNHELESEANRLILKNADVAVIVINQNIMELAGFKNRMTKIMQAVGRIPMFVTINKFCDVQGSLRETASMMGIKAPKNWSTVRYNPWVGYGTNFGKMNYICNKIRNSDYRVDDVASDIKALANLIIKVKVVKRQMSKETRQRVIENKSVKKEGGEKV